MPQVDLETLVSACAGGGNNNDRKITCETLADTVANNSKQAELPPDFPPDSFWLSKDAEFDWFDRNAFLERKESTKGIGPNQYSNLNSNSNSQRFSSNLKAKASILGLPKTQKTSFIDSNRRNCKPANIRLFPAKRSESTLKVAGSVTEPASPKVSCMGRVRSKRSRRKLSEKTGKRSEKSVGKKKTGFYSRLLSIFRSNREQKKQVRSVTESALGSEPVVKPLRKSKSVSAAREYTVCVEPVSEPGLGGMKRFASGRRSESWGSDEISAVL